MGLPDWAAAAVGGGAITGIGMMVVGWFKFRADTKHNQSVDLLAWTQQANEEARKLREELLAQEQKCRADMGSMEARHHSEMESLKNELEKTQNQFRLMMIDYHSNGCVNPKDYQNEQ